MSMGHVQPGRGHGCIASEGCWSLSGNQRASQPRPKKRSDEAQGTVNPFRMGLGPCASSSVPDAWDSIIRFRPSIPRARCLLGSPAGCCFCRERRLRREMTFSKFIVENMRYQSRRRAEYGFTFYAKCICVWRVSPWRLSTSPALPAMALLGQTAEGMHLPGKGTGTDVLQADAAPDGGRD